MNAKAVLLLKIFKDIMRKLCKNLVTCHLKLNASISRSANYFLQLILFGDNLEKVFNLKSVAVQSRTSK